MADRTLELVRRGYPWGASIRGGADAVPARVLGRRAAVVGGPAGVRRFYDPRLRRRGSLPKPLQLVLFGPGTVHALDGAEHHHRKAMFLDVLAPEAVAALGVRAEQEWASAVRRWRDDVVLFDEAVHVLTAAVLPWAGVPVTPDELPRRARLLAEVVDGFAAPGPAYLRAVVARARLGRWARRLVRRVREERLRVAPGTALAAAAAARSADGRPLPERVAAVALLNVVRPTIAVAWFIAFAGRALHEHPQWRDRIAAGDEAALDAFVQEVRRLYPFVPVLAARTRQAQDVLGVPVPRGGFVVLDVHGTDHDPALWPDPDRFDPERFLHGPVDPDTLVPQGGGEVTTGHRCPGETVTLTMLAAAVRTLARVPHTLPPQDLAYDLSRVPTRPRSGVVLRLPGEGA
ncbi:MAG TPA: cytochrome P450 [Pseudonocardia sp.]|jgi:fatty-acid peroxygenase|nr:cytochrome P450 [Pseudonocardia sp.]